MKRFWKRAVCMLLTAILFAGLLPVLTASASAMTLEERQQAVVAVALAYFDKGRGVQYDGVTISPGAKRGRGYTRSTNEVAPEYATPDETMYSVCSDYAHQVYYEACRYHLTGSAGNCWTGKILDIPKDDPITLYYWDKKSGKDVKEAIHEMFAIAQPGDVFTTYSTAGHTMIYVGDVFGDGVKYLAHCFGTKINKETGSDGREYGEKDTDIDPRFRSVTYKDNNGGAIRLTPNAEEHYLKAYGKGNQVRMNLLRPLNGMTEADHPMTAATMYRVSHPRLSINRIVKEKTRFLSAETGDKLTLEITLKNSSKKAYSVPVTEKVPAGAKLVKDPEGATVSGDTIKWNVELPAGGEKVLTVEYEATAKRWEQIVFAGGSVGDIPSNSITITVGGKKLTAEENAKLLAVANGDYDELLKGTKDAELGNFIYQKVLGLNVTLPTLKEVAQTQLKETVFTEKKKSNLFKNIGDITDAEKPVFRYLVPTLHGGTKCYNDWGIERCNDPRDKHLEPGDVLVRAKDLAKSQTSTLVYLGDGKYLSYDAKNDAYPILEEPDFVASLLFDAFYVVRPTLAFDDIHANAGTPAAAAPYKNPFTDVKENDWFYPFVKELSRTKKVNGTTATTYAPNASLTYGQALKLIGGALGEKEPTKSGTHWASGWLTLAKKNKWLSGDVDLDAPISRLAFCQTASKAKGITSAPKTNPFTDTSDKAVLALYKAGIISGMTEKTFEPETLLTRAQIAKIILRLTLRK